MTLSEVKPVENIRKNLQSFLEMSPLQKEVLLSHKLKDHACEYQNPFGLRKSHTELECQESLIQAKIRNQENSNEGLKYS